MSRQTKAGKAPVSNQPKTSGLKVGVTIFLREGTQTLWENGIFQNAGFLLMLLKESRLFDNVFLVNGGPGMPENSREFLANSPSPVITMAEAMNELDVIIELSAQLNPDWAKDFKARGGTVIAMRVANDFVIDAERMTYNLDPGMLFTKVPYDEIWTLPAFAKTCASYYRFGHSAPVHVMQHLWSPVLVDQSAKEFGKPFRYRPAAERWRLAILEPNICSVKTCHLPMMLCEVAYRANPSAIQHMYVFNALALKEHASFIGYARSMSIVQHGVGTFEGRLPVFQIMTELADAVVSHHCENGQNYLYYEMLHGGYPLIHNSAFLGTCGYRYNDYDPEDGALALLRAKAEHDLNLDSYRAEAREFLKTLDPLNPVNVQNFETAIIRAMGRTQQ
jgi:hypothetical protein